MLKPSNTWSCRYRFLFDGVPCEAWCRFDDKIGILRSITFEPVYMGESGFACEDPEGNAEMCKKRLLEVWGKPEINESCGRGDFNMVYGFDQCQVSTGLEYVSKDRVPIWYGLEIEFL